MHFAGRCVTVCGNMHALCYNRSMTSIRIPDTVYDQLKDFADSEMRSLSNATEYLLMKGLSKDTPKPLDITNKRTRTKKIILGEIKSLEASADDSNQDPDYWREVSDKKNALWKEYHATEE